MTCFRRFLVITAGLAVLLTVAAPATAQLVTPPAEMPVGEDYGVEVFGGLWNPSPDMTISSDEFGIAGTESISAATSASARSGSVNCGCGCARRASTASASTTYP